MENEPLSPGKVKLIQEKKKTLNDYLNSLKPPASKRRKL
jgi:hypothetical protein